VARRLETADRFYSATQTVLEKALARSTKADPRGCARRDGV